MTLGDIYICRFPLTSGAAGKPRPSLLLFDLGMDVIICRMTSVARSGVMDLSIQDWQAAGLLGPAVARLDRLVTAEKTLLHRHLGTLSVGDLTRVRQRWNKNMTL